MFRYKTFDELTDDERSQFYRACLYRYRLIKVISRYIKHKRKYRVLLDDLYKELFDSSLEIQKWSYQIKPYNRKEY